MSAVPESVENAVEFLLIAESGVLEAQALLLCESIRRFAGAYAHCPITVVSPRPARRPSQSAIRTLEGLRAEYLPIDIRSCCPEYGTSYRVHAAAHVERRQGPPLIVQLDSDTLFVGEPDFSLFSCHAAARPVDVKGMCTTGPDDPFDGFWRQLCALAGVSYDRLPLIRTTVDRMLVRASYNGGLLVTLRDRAIFQRTEEIFVRLVGAGMQPWTSDGPLLRTGTGFLRGAATAYWGTSQAAFSLAAVAGGHDVRELPASHNFPLHSLGQLTTPVPTPLVHVHYHWMFDGDQPNPLLGGDLGVSGPVADWLKLRVPLRGDSAGLPPG
jgi:hypothetical protein